MLLQVNKQKFTLQIDREKSFAEVHAYDGLYIFHCGFFFSPGVSVEIVRAEAKRRIIAEQQRIAAKRQVKAGKQADFQKLVQLDLFELNFPPAAPLALASPDNKKTKKRPAKVKN